MHLELLEPFARTVVIALGVGVLESAALALLVLAMTKLRPRPSATTRHVLWWLTLAASAILPIVSVASSLGHIEHQRIPAAVVADASSLKLAPPSANYSSVVEESPARARVQAPPPEPSAAFAPLVAAVERSLPSGETLRYIGLGSFALWLLVAAGGLVSLTRSLVVLRRIKLAASPLDESVTRRLRRWRHSSRLGRAVSLSVSNEVDVPVAVGFRLPMILLPAQVVETEEIADIDQIAMHEYAHLDRYDDWTNLLQRFIERLFWFNPVIAFVGRRISLEREIACDDWVVAQTGRAHRYATCLWKLVESSRLPAKPILAPGALLTPKQITVRIEQLLDARRNALPRLSPVGALVVGALCIGLIVVQAQRAPVIALVEPASPALAVAAAKPADVVRPFVATRPAAAHANPKALATASPAEIAAPSEAAKLAAERIEISAERAKLEVTRAQLAQSAAARVTIAAQSPQGRLERLLPVRREPITIAVVAPEPAAALNALAAPDPQPFAPAFRRALERSTRTVALLNARVLVLDNGHRVSFGAGLEPPAPPQRAATRASLERCAGCDLSHANLRGLNLNHISLIGASLRGADLTGANLSGARLIGVDLREATLDGADLRSTFISNSDLSNSSFRNVRIDGIKVVGTIFSGMLAEGTRLRSAIDRCQGCDLHLLDLRGQDLRGVHLNGVDLHEADLRNVLLTEAVFEGVDMHGARLAGADLHNAKLHACNLHSTDFTGANLTGLSVEGSDISTAYARFGSYLHFVKVKVELQKHQALPAVRESLSDLDVIVNEIVAPSANAPSRTSPTVNAPSHNELD